MRRRRPLPGFRHNEAASATGTAYWSRSVNNISALWKGHGQGKRAPRDSRKAEGAQTFGLANTGCYVLLKVDIRLHKKGRKKREGRVRADLGCRDALQKEKVAVEEASFWQPVSYTWSLLAVNEVMLRRLDDGKQRIAPSATWRRGWCSGDTFRSVKARWSAADCIEGRA